MNNGVVSGSGRLDLNASALAAARRRLTGGDDQRLDGNGIIYDVEHQSQTTEKERILRTLAQMDGRSSVRNNATAHTQAVMRRRAAAQRQTMLVNHMGLVNTAAQAAQVAQEPQMAQAPQAFQPAQAPQPVQSVRPVQPAQARPVQPMQPVQAQPTAPVRRATVNVATANRAARSVASTYTGVSPAHRVAPATSVKSQPLYRAAVSTPTAAAFPKISQHRGRIAADAPLALRSSTAARYRAAQAIQPEAPVAPARPVEQVRVQPTAHPTVHPAARPVARPTARPVVQQAAPAPQPVAQPEVNPAAPAETVQSDYAAEAYQPEQSVTPDFIDLQTDLANNYVFGPAEELSTNTEAAQPAETEAEKDAAADQAAADALQAAAEVKTAAKPAAAKTNKLAHLVHHVTKPAVTSAEDPFAPLNIGHESQAESVKDKAKAGLEKAKTVAKQAHTKAKKLSKQVAKQAVKKLKAFRDANSVRVAKRVAQERETVAQGAASTVAAASAAVAQPQFAVATATAATTKAAQPAPQPTAPISVNTAGAAALEQPNLFDRVAGAKVAISFKFNRALTLNIIRYAAIVVVIGISAYLAWDTYNTNRGVQSNFDSPAQAMSIAGVNPATADQTAVSSNDRQAYTVAADLPRIINIPVINVTARVRTVGVNSRGDIDTPKNLNDTAWYDGSAKPNQEGQVFIDGHTSFSRNITAAFNDLNKVRDGDQIYIETGNGAKFKYRVTGVKTVDANKVDMGEALNTQDGAHKGLTLMTCTGTFNYRTQTADKRLIVYAVQEEDKS